jgi:hypothetical protein
MTPHQNLRNRLAAELGCERTPDEAESLLESMREFFEVLEGRELTDEEVVQMAIDLGFDGG